MRIVIMVRVNLRIYVHTFNVNNRNSGRSSESRALRPGDELNN